ncbi:hypothetical protein GHT09_001396 [Marmota monax]|uniref:Serine/arginine repetitive matrix protein C-terminal domain-containing protein n=1 Tax=Marmota monax TaxID=9995 RepID=A0A834V983_MARMO|nr:hypothetical protein GHT09_001396 [Marmota monax]
MASVQQGEKQLFEKFWRGTFKAVATPRPESIIVASITARKPLPRTEPQSSPIGPAQDGPSEKLGQRLATEALGTNSWERDKACRELGPARARSASLDRDFTPPPSSRGKKKKKKSARKKRRRSPSYSPSPVKKKKKKSSKKHKRRRYHPSSFINRGLPGPSPRREDTGKTRGLRLLILLPASLNQALGQFLARLPPPPLFLGQPHSVPGPATPQRSGLQDSLYVGSCTGHCHEWTHSTPPFTPVTSRSQGRHRGGRQEVPSRTPSPSQAPTWQILSLSPPTTRGPLLTYQSRAPHPRHLLSMEVHELVSPGTGWVDKWAPTSPALRP